MARYTEILNITEKEWKNFRNNCSHHFREDYAIFYVPSLCRKMVDSKNDSFYLCRSMGCPLLKDHLKEKVNSIDEQFIFEVTCWKCWRDITNISHTRAEFPFRVLTSSIKSNNVFEEFCKANFIRKAGMNQDFIKTYKCPRCSYDDWQVGAVYYPYLYLYVQEIKKGLRK